MNKEDLERLTDNVKNLPRDARLAMLQGSAGTQFDVVFDNGERYKCTVGESLAVIANILGFYDEAEELGLTPKSNK